MAKQKFEVWCEGYVMNGECGYASYCGSFEAESFKDACDMAMKYSSTYNPDTLCDWGMKLYDNKKEALELTMNHTGPIKYIDQVSNDRFIMYFDENDNLLKVEDKMTDKEYIPRWNN